MQLDQLNAGEDRRAAVLLLASAVAFCAIQLGILVPNHDIAWLLELSQRMLHGGKYYIDFYELNPPLYPILLLPVDLLSGLTGAAPYTILVIGVSGLLYYVSLKLFSCLTVLAPELGSGSRLALAVCMQAGLFFLPGYDFGQRDPVALCLTLPLVCWLSTERPASQASRQIVLAALLAMLGILIKPFLAGVIAVSVVLRIAATRRIVELLVPVVLPAAVVTGVYVILILEVFPEWIVMAHVAGDSYGMYDIHTFVPKWFRSALFLSAVFAVTNEYLNSSPASRRAVRYFVAATLGALVSYLAQRKGFSYHLVPTKITLWLLLVLTAITVLQYLKTVIAERVYLQRGALLFCLLLSLVAFAEDHRSMSTQREPVKLYARLATKLTDVHAGNRLFFFSTSLVPEFPLTLYYNFTPSSRFPCLWTLPAALGQTPGAVALSHELRNLVAADFRRWAPTAFIVSEAEQQQGIGGHFEFLSWFREDPRLRDILDRYQLVSQVSGLRAADAPTRDIYSIYVLREPHVALAQAVPSTGD